MKKILLLCCLPVLLSGCEDKKQYEQAVLDRMQVEKDIKDYNIDPQQITDCIVDLTSKKMPGAFLFDPDRLMAYRNYAKMLNLAKSEDPTKTMQELRSNFGSPKGLAEAHTNYAESMMYCMSSIMMKTEEQQGS